MSAAIPEDGQLELRSSLMGCISTNQRRYSRIRLFERLERLPKVGWLFGHYKRAFVTRKLISPLPAPRVAAAARSSNSR